MSAAGSPGACNAHHDCASHTIAALWFTSRSGSIAYHSNADVANLVWSDRAGNQLGTVGVSGDYQGVRISPDGGRVLFDRSQPGVGTYDLWTWDLARGVETRLTSDPMLRSELVCATSVRSAARIPALMRVSLRSCQRISAES